MSSYDNKRIGHRKDKNGNVQAYNRFVSNMEELLDENVQELLAEEVLDIQDEVEEIANKELSAYYSFVSEKMGLVDKPSLYDKGANTFFSYNVFNRVVWFPLSKRTRELKRKHGGESAENVKWFSYDPRHKDSTLKDYLKGLSFTGTATVTVEKFTGNDARFFGKNKRDEAEFYQLKLDIPLEEENIIEGIGDEAQTVKAFGNPRGRRSNEERRPIFNPIAEYFTRQRIPRVIKETMKRRGRNVEFN